MNADIIRNENSLLTVPRGAHTKVSPCLFDSSSEKRGQDHRRLTGIIREAEDLEYDGGLESYEADWLGEIFDWLNAELPIPRFFAGRWPHSAVCRFKIEADQPIRRMWEISAILSEHGVPVRILRSADPGKVPYEDSFQVVVKQWRGLWIG